MKICLVSKEREVNQVSAQEITTHEEFGYKTINQDRVVARDPIVKAKTTHGNEAVVFREMSLDHSANIASVGKVVVAISKGAAGLWRRPKASVVRELTGNMDLKSVDREKPSSFLSGGERYCVRSAKRPGHRHFEADERRGSGRPWLRTQEGGYPGEDFRCR